MTKLALITINHHHGEMIKKMVESLLGLGTEQPFNLFVINNLKDEGTTQWLAQAVPNVEVVENAQPQGFSSNINRIIRDHPDFDFYLLLNPDVICLPGDLSGGIYAAFERWQSASLCPLAPTGERQP